MLYRRCTSVTVTSWVLSLVLVVHNVVENTEQRYQDLQQQHLQQQQPQHHQQQHQQQQQPLPHQQQPQQHQHQQQQQQQNLSTSSQPPSSTAMTSPQQQSPSSSSSSSLTPSSSSSSPPSSSSPSSPSPPTIINSEEEYLLRYLFEDYNPSARPVMHSDDVVDVNLRFSLLQIQELNVRNQILTSTGFLILEWTDERLSWDNNVSNLDEIVVKGDSIWTPEFAVINGVDSIYGEYNEFQAIIKPNGTVRWEPGGIFKTMCSINIAYYPFDTQSCVMKFGAWSYITTKMNLSTTESIVRRDTYEENGEWEVTSTSAERQEFAFEDFPLARYSYICFSIELKRRHTFYIMNVIVPGLLTSAVLLSLFYCVPSQKVHIGVAALLSFRLFLVNVADTVPRTSDHVPLLGVYLTCTMAITTLAMVATVFVGNLYERKDRPVPKWMKTLLLGHMAKLLCLNHYVSSTRGEGAGEKKRKNKAKNRRNKSEEDVKGLPRLHSKLSRCCSASCLSLTCGGSTKNSGDITDDDNSSELKVDEEIQMMATYNPRNRRTKVKTQKGTKNGEDEATQDSKKAKKVERSRSFDVSSALAMMAKRQVGDLGRLKAGIVARNLNVDPIPATSSVDSPPAFPLNNTEDDKSKLETVFVTEPEPNLRRRNLANDKEDDEEEEDIQDTNSTCSSPTHQRDEKCAEIVNYSKDWGHLAAVCDRFFFWLCLCFILATTVLLFHPKFFRRSMGDDFINTK